MSGKEEREHQVRQMLANQRLEGLEPDEAHQQLLQAYIDGTASLDDLHEHAIIAALMAQDDGAAAQAHLDAGRAIYYCHEAYPNMMIRKWPDGQRELVKVFPNGKIEVLREL